MIHFQISGFNRAHQNVVKTNIFVHFVHLEENTPADLCSSRIIFYVCITIENEKD